MCWIDRAAHHADAVGLSHGTCEDVVRHPERIEPDLTQPGRSYEVVRYSRGDITVVVGLQDPARPAVVHVEVHAVAHAAGRSRAGSNRGRVANAPTTSKGLRGYLVNRGCHLERGGSGHYKVYRAGRYLGTVGNTVRPCSLAADFQRMRRILDQADGTSSAAA